MKDKIPTKHLMMIILLVIITAIIFAVISTTQLLQQAHNDSSQISGQIVSVSEQEVTIRNKRGRETVLIINDDTEIHGNIETLVSGQFIHSFGTKLDDDTFKSKDIRVVKKP